MLGIKLVIFPYEHIIFIMVLALSNDFPEQPSANLRFKQSQHTAVHLNWGLVGRIPYFFFSPSDVFFLIV